MTFQILYNTLHSGPHIDSSNELLLGVKQNLDNMSYVFFCHLRSMNKCSNVNWSQKNQYVFIGWGEMNVGNKHCVFTTKG